MIRRVILSRKGVDSAAGGRPSPILPDGRLFSLPIPQRPPRPIAIGTSAMTSFRRLSCSAWVEGALCIPIDPATLIPC